MIAALMRSHPNYFTPAWDEDTIEVFPDLESAIVALIERYHSNGRRSESYTTLSGKQCIALFPTFDEGSSFECYAVAGALDDKPTEDQVLDALTDVHTGCWTWTLTLARDTEDAMTVTVKANR